MESGDPTTGWENNQEGDSGQLEHVCGQPGDQLRGRFDKETRWTLMISRVPRGARLGFIIHYNGELCYSGLWGRGGASDFRLCCNQGETHVHTWTQTHLLQRAVTYCVWECRWSYADARVRRHTRTPHCFIYRLYQYQSYCCCPLKTISSISEVQTSLQCGHCTVAQLKGSRFPVSQRPQHMAVVLIIEYNI